ncbi:flagellar protein FlaG [Clostridium fungisolvens]|uniref:Flagellar protein FlaG n=1 Tax=Clostridium fungisolvens TaxID=1604897 RepID=A0A6V8SIR5_9CLOT|nr:flagellar protein FlaG [Clostridium fungisolvens]GFP77119.1 hypothetical protein bsdtw1_03233 [Clostridium fungisolvens]
MEIRGNQVTQAAIDSTSQTKPIETTNASAMDDKKSLDIKNKNNEREIKKAVEKLNRFLEGDNTHAVYEVHDKFKSDIIIKIVDDRTKEVLMEVPPKKILDIVAKMCELVGVMFDKKV